MDTVAQKRYAQSLFQAATREAYTCPRTQTERKKRSSSPFTSKINSHATIEKKRKRVLEKREEKKEGRGRNEELRVSHLHAFGFLFRRYFWHDGIHRPLPWGLDHLSRNKRRFHRVALCKSIKKKCVTDI